MKKYFEKLGIKVLKTMAQSAVGVIGASTLISQVDWRVVVSTALLSGLVCVLTLSLIHISEPTRP